MLMFNGNITLTMLLIISNHTQNSIKRLRYSAVIFQIDLNILKMSYFTYHVTKSPKEAVSLDGKWFPKSYTFS